MSESRAGTQSGRRNRHGICDTLDFVACVKEAIIKVFHFRKWSSAFEHNGYGSSQTLVHMSTLADLRLTNPPNVELGCPTVTELSLCLPRNMPNSVQLVRRLFLDAAPVEDATACRDEAAGNAL